MIILFICTNADLAGAPIHVRGLVQEFRNKAHVIAIFGEDGDVAQELRRGGTDVHVIDKLSSSINPKNDLIVLLKIIHLIRKISPDIVHLHSSKAGMLGRIACFFTSTAWIYTVHGWGWRGFGKLKSKLIFFVEKVLSKVPGGLYIYVSKSVESEAIKMVGIIPKKGRVIFNGVSDNGFLSPSVGPLHILMAARVSYAKDHETLIRAFDSVRCPSSLILCGDGTDTDQFIRKVESWAPKRHGEIMLLGVRGDVYSLLEKINVFALISNFEALPISIIEAMSCGRAVIATNVGGCSELIEHEVNGLLVERGDVNEVAHSIERLHDVKFRTRLGLEGRKRYEASYEASRMFSEIWELYIGCLRGK